MTTNNKSKQEEKVADASTLQKKIKDLDHWLITFLSVIENLWKQIEDLKLSSDSAAVLKIRELRETARFEWLGIQRVIEEKKLEILETAQRELRGKWVSVWQGGKRLEMEVKAILKPPDNTTLFILIGKIGRSEIRAVVGIKTEFSLNFDKGLVRKTGFRRMGVIGEMVIETGQIGRETLFLS
jgi:hypothetical protein